MTEPTPTTPDDSAVECDDAPKLTADEWAYIAAVTPGTGGDD